MKHTVIRRYDICRYVYFSRCCTRDLFDIKSLWDFFTQRFLFFAHHTVLYYTYSFEVWTSKLTFFLRIFNNTRIKMCCTCVNRIRFIKCIPNKNRYWVIYCHHYYTHTHLRTYQYADDDDGNVGWCERENQKTNEICDLTHTHTLKKRKIKLRVSDSI